ncbi:MAG: hypothetical protein KAR43_12470, partial [Deltaproteobacteria bacterium]|nr:hypothetical protein [Deltaproteobacteria bacterium]
MEKMKSKKLFLTIVSLLAVTLILSFAAYQGIVKFVPSAEAAGGKVTDPNGTAPDRYIYYPGTEELGKDEIRLIALGTGMPAARRSQAATCWLVEVGNGDKFLFDIGTGAN